MTELLRLEKVDHRFSDGSLGLSEISLCLNQGDFLVLAGRNGSGKSLLVRHLLGLCRPSSGRVLYRGVPISAQLEKVRSALGLVFQEAEAQIIGQTVDEDVAFGPENLRLPRRLIEERREKAMRRVHLDGLGGRLPDSLSGGERRRLAIAGSLAMEAECLILDEPFANLDLPSIRLCLETIVELHASGTTILLLTHELEKVLAHANRLAIMERGRLAYDGSPDDFYPEEFERYGLANPYRSYQRRADLSWLPPHD